MTYYMFRGETITELMTLADRVNPHPDTIEHQVHCSDPQCRASYREFLRDEVEQLFGPCEADVRFDWSPTGEDGHPCGELGKVRENGQSLCDPCWDGSLDVVVHEPCPDVEGGEKEGTIL